MPYIGLYQLTNRMPVRPPTELPMTWLDRLIPFVPELLPLYVAYIPFYLWTVARSENDREASRIFYATHAQLLICLPIFVLFPVRMPRELFYAPDLYYGFADVFWRWFDGPNNCFPSLHVASCLVLIEFNWRRKWQAIHTITALLIIVSTVLVKQHYVVDVVGGGGVYFFSRLLTSRIEIAGVDASGWRPSRPALSRAGGRQRSA